MELDFFIDGTLYDNPINWNEINVSIEFDPVNQLTTISHEADMQWKGDVYNLLYNAYLNDSLCNLLPIEIKARSLNNQTLFTGQINVAKCTFNERKKTVQVPILDDSFGARIENNKGARVALDSTQTKNGEPITITEAFETMFTPSDGVYLSDTTRGYYVHDAFEFLVKWMSDNTISFQSDFFDPTLSNEGSLDWLVSGIDLRNVGQSVSAPKFSFQELFDVMRRIRNIGMGFQTDSSGNVTVRIEDIDYFRSNTDTILLEDVNETELSFEQNILYTSVKIGSDIIKKNDCSTECNASSNVSYFGFETEYYALSGECNTGVELDLSVTDPFIVDTNKIQEVVEFEQDTYDDRTFIIKLSSGIAQAEKSDPLGIGENWYNEAYTNKEILARYQDYLVGSLSLYSLYNNSLNLFLYEGTSNSGRLLPLQAPNYTTYPTTAGNGFPMNNLIYDPQNRIDTGTERFTPVDEGAYQFCCGINVDEFPSSPPAVIIFFYLQIEQYDSSNTLINTYQSDLRSYLTSAPPNFEEWVSPYISMDAGDYAVFTISYAQNVNPAVIQGEVVFGLPVTNDNYFQCCNSVVAVQDAQINTGQKRQLALTRFEYPIPFETFQDFYEDTTQAIRITSKGIDRTGYVNSMSYNFVKGDAEISIVSNG